MTITVSGSPASPTQIDALKADLAIDQVDNTSDASKPVSTAQAAADTAVGNAAAAALSAHATSTSNPHSVTKAQVGLGNVDNTSDVNKPVSTAQQTALDAKLNLSGGTMTGPIVLSADASASMQAVTYQQLQAAVMGVGKRSRVRVASTANINLASPGATINGVTMAAGDQFLAKDQTTPAQNGVYVWNGSAVAATRAAEFDTWAEFPGSIIGVYEGTVAADTLWFCTNNDGGTLGTTAIVFSQFNVAGALLATNNLSDLANAGTARTNLGVAIGSDVQAFDADLAAIAALVSAANKMLYATGAGAWALADLTAAARALLDDADAATMRQTLGAAALTIPRRDVTGTTDTILAADNGGFVYYSNAGAIAVGIGTSFNGLNTQLVWPTSAGTITITPTGVTLNGSSSPLVLSAAGGAVAIVPIGTNAFAVVGSIGDLVAADVTDSGATGRSLLQAADVPTARSVLSPPQGTTISASRALAAGDINKITRVDTGGGAVALTLNASTIAAGQIMLFQRNGANALTFPSGTANVSNPDSITVPDGGIVAVVGSLVTAGDAVLA